MTGGRALNWLLPAALVAFATVACAFTGLDAQVLPLSAESRRIAAACAVSLAYAAFCVTLIRHHRSRHTSAIERQPPAADGRAGSFVVAFASQTGTAETLAEATAYSLVKGGVPARLRPLSALDVAQLNAVETILFVVSTTGEGDPPDDASHFVRSVMGGSPPLPRLRYGLLALGDREYSQFCAFGRALDNWLRAQGANPLFDAIEVNNGDRAALDLWQARLLELGVQAHVHAAPPASDGRWTLTSRNLLNPECPDFPAFHICLTQSSGTPPIWQAGDIAVIRPRHAPETVEEFLRKTGLCGNQTVALDGAGVPLRDLLACCVLPESTAEIAALTALPPESLSESLRPLPTRDYSIASLATDGGMELLVRGMRHPDGRPGLGSGWLTLHAAIGDEIAVHVRTNRNFHGPAPERPLILIGNGTGIAGLRAHQKARALAGRGDNWLIFGERRRAQDFFYQAEIESWQSQGMLARVDLAFSRDQPERVYVQDILRREHATLSAWIARGAAVYVCGSRDGMAGGVDRVLRDVLGDRTVDEMSDSRLYRRDIY